MVLDLRRFARQAHLYLGLFIAPSVLFFALTGALQTFSLHEASPQAASRPAHWIVLLAQIHKKQTTQIPVRKAPLPLPNSNQEPQRASVPASTGGSRLGALPLKCFFVLVSLGLFISTFSGLYMSCKYTRNRFALISTLIAGVVVPVCLTIL